MTTSKRSRITPEFYNELLAAYRQHPGVFARAARLVGCDTRTAKKAWAEGWPDKGLDPIQEVVEDEQAAARARLKEQRAAELAEQQRAAEREQERRDMAAVDDAIAARAEEAQTVRAARHNSMALLITTQRMLRAGAKLADRIENEVAEQTIKPANAIALFQAMASTARQANETARLALSMERQLLGDPDKVVEHRHTMRVENPEREIEAAGRALERARKRGLVVDGTAEPAEPVPEQ